MLNPVLILNLLLSKKIFIFELNFIKMTMHKFLEKDQVQFTKLAKFALGTMSIDEQEDVLERIEYEKNKWLNSLSVKKTHKKIEVFNYKYVSVVLKFEDNDILVFDIVNQNFFNIRNYISQNEGV